jgi:hypothetical protein
LALNADGSFIYTPNANFNGSDSFTYHANDGLADSNIATVTITVNAVNDAPVANNDAYTTDEDTVLTVLAPGVLGNDTDADGDPLTAALVSSTSNGTLALNADGSFDYTPNAGFNGSDSFTYHANDGTVDSNIATVNITVNAAATIDLDITRFQVTKGVWLASKKGAEVAIKLTVTNGGLVNLGVVGDITWTVTIADDDPDLDEATATTSVK